MSASTADNLALVTHIFTLNGVQPEVDGLAVADVLQLGRFDANFRHRPVPAMRILDIGSFDRIEVSAANSTLGCISMHAALWHGALGLGQLHIQHLEVADASVVANMLDFFCHRRTKLEIDGEPFMHWVQRVARLTTLPWLDQDVLDIVVFPPAHLERMTVDGQPSESALRLLYRNPHSTYARGGNIEMPIELNRGGSSFAAHGRGVAVFCAHQPSRELALRVTAAELLFAIATARTSRQRIELELRLARGSDTSSRWANLHYLQGLTNTVRLERIRLAVDVRAAVDGLFMPESVLDAFRTSLGRTLRFEELADSSLALADTLSEVVASYLEDVRLELAAEASSRERRWQLIVGVASGVAIPIALLFSFLGVSSDKSAPSDVAASDYSFYLIPYLSTVAAMVLIVIISIYGYRRTRVTKNRQEG